MMSVRSRLIAQRRQTLVPVTHLDWSTFQLRGGAAVRVALASGSWVLLRGGVAVRPEERCQNVGMSWRSSQ